MGRFKDLVDTSAAMEAFRVKYHILQGVVLRYYPPEGVLIDRDVGEIVILMVAFIEGGMTLPMRRITQDYLFHYRLTPHQCTPNMFRVLGCIDVLNERMGLGLTWHDVVHLYECHYVEKGGYYLKSWSDVVRLISCLPISNKTMKDDFLIALGEWSDSFHCPTWAGISSAAPLGPIL